MIRAELEPPDQAGLPGASMAVSVYASEFGAVLVLGRCAATGGGDDRREHELVSSAGLTGQE